MALRIFADTDGQSWRVWSVQPSANGLAVRPNFQDGWLCFERVNGGDRCRLPAADAPDGWAELPDERLDLLRRMANAGTPAHGTMQIEREEDPRSRSASGNASGNEA